MTSPLSDEDFRGVARSRVKKAMEHLEAAQRHIDAAARELCPIVGGAAQWCALARLADRVQARWFAVERWLERRGSKLDLDGTSRAEMTQQRRIS